MILCHICFYLGKSLVWVMILGILIIYIYTLVAFAFFRSSFSTQSFLYCRTLYECAVTIIRYGLIGDINQVGTSSLFCITSSVFVHGSLSVCVYKQNYLSLQVCHTLFLSMEVVDGWTWSVRGNNFWLICWQG